MAEIAQDRLAAIRANFLARLTTHLARLEGLATDPQGREDIMAIAHSIAGIAGSLGFPELSAIASALERECLSSPDADPATMTQFTDLTTAIRNAG